MKCPLLSALCSFLLLFLASCSQPPPKPAEQTIIWERAGSWSGRGDVETNSFPSNGYLRFTWETTNETTPGEGRFKLILGSSISGRAIMTLVDHKGAGRDVAYVSEEARTFYIKVESANEDWKVIVDEGSAATIERTR
jgi:hypothetical protein